MGEKGHKPQPPLFRYPRSRITCQAPTPRLTPPANYAHPRLYIKHPGAYREG
nr:MAG TPA: hypothetical protein [Caudoviricetes sp.]